MDPNQPGPPVTDSAINPYAAPASSFAPAPTSDAPASPVKAARIAGAIMLASAPAALLSSTGKHDALPGDRDRRADRRLARARQPQVPPWAVLRCVVGALFYGGMSVANGQPIEAVFTGVYTGGLLLLLLGTPGKARTIVGAVAAGVLAALTYVGLLVGGAGG